MEETNEVTEETAGETEEKVYTKADVETMMQKRLSKFADYDDVKTELDTLKASIEAGDLVKEAVETAKAEVKQAANGRLVKAEAKALASQMNFHYPSDAHLYIDVNKVDVEDDEINMDSLKGQLETVVKERPNLVRSTEKVTRTEAGLGIQGKAPKRTTGQLFAEALESL